MSIVFFLQSTYVHTTQNVRIMFIKFICNILLLLLLLIYYVVVNKQIILNINNLRLTIKIIFKQIYCKLNAKALSFLLDKLENKTGRKVNPLNF